MVDETIKPICYTRADLARILRVSPKQAGRIMETMPTIIVGKAHRRVLIKDFEHWLERTRRVPDFPRIRAARDFSKRQPSTYKSVLELVERAARGEN